MPTYVIIIYEAESHSDDVGGEGLPPQRMITQILKSNSGY